MATKKKKIVTKDDLRRLMKEKQYDSKYKAKKIDHPLAKYNGLDQLVCVLCNSVIKSDILWTAHLQTKQHKEKLVTFKSQPSESAKRKSSDVESNTDTKRLKGPKNGHTSGSIPADFFDNGPPKSSKSTTKPSILSQYDSSDSDSEDDTRSVISTKSTISEALKGTKSALPADFFDSGVMPSASEPKEEEEEEIKPAKMSEVLPEGFFDDPKQDAKVRNVEYVDKMEEEWELFQKTMKEEQHVSENIIEEEDEQVNVERNIDEIDEQIQCWKEVNDLEIRKEEVMKKGTQGNVYNMAQKILRQCWKEVNDLKIQKEEVMKKGPQGNKKDDDSEEELDETDLDEFLDWRSKKSR